MERLKSHAALLEELSALRTRVAEAERIGVQHRRAEATLRENQRALATLIGNLPGMVYRCRNDRAWTMEFVSSGCYELTGYESGDLVGNRMVAYADLIHPDDRESVWERVQAGVSAHQRFQITYRLRTHDSNQKWVWEQGCGVFAESGEVLALEGFICDVSDRARVEESLRESQALLHVIVSSTSDALLLMNESGIVVVFNPGAEAVFGRPRSAAIGKPLEQFIAPEGWALMRKRIEALSHSTDDLTRADRLFEVSALHADGREIPLEVSLAAGRCGGERGLRYVVAAARDISPRRQADEMRRQRAERVERQRTAIVRLATDPALSSGNLGVAARTFTETAAEALQVERVGFWLFDANRERLRAIDIYTRSSDEHAGGATLSVLECPNYIAALAKGRAVNSSDAQHDPHTVEFNDSYLVPLGITSMLDAPIRLGGKVVGVICHEHVGPPRTWEPDEETFASEVADQAAQALLHRDQLRADNRERRLEARMVESQRLESLGLLAGGIAHDFNNLLVGILGYAGLAEMELPPDSPARDSIQKSCQIAQRAADLTRQLLAYSGQGRLATESLNLSTVVAEMADMLRTSISKKAELQISCAPEMPLFEGDATQIRQVVMNLILNASDALGDNPGLVSISTGVTNADADYLDSCVVADAFPQGECVFVEVEDTGCGMDKHTLSRIFDPLFTTKFVGHGLGLAAALSIVRGHRGAIRVDSTLGHGSAFRVLFPISRDSAQGELDTSEYPGDLTGAGVVLVIDDEDAVRKLAAAALRRFDFTPLVAGDAQEAVDTLRKHVDEVCAIVLDFAMPRVNTEDLYHELRAIAPDVPIILSSGYAEADALERVRRIELAGFLQKPYLPTQLVQKVRGVMRR